MKRLSTFFAAFFMLVSVSMAQQTDYWDGSVTPFSTDNNAGESAENPILINSGAQLAYLAQQVNDINDPNLYDGKFFKLTTDIDLDGNEWTPIGWHLTNAYNRHFGGSFDGNGHIISNLVISKDILIPAASGTGTSNISSYALFGAVQGSERGARYIKNLGIESGSIKGTGSVAAFVAWGAGVTIAQCYNKASIDGTSYVGGIAAYCVSPSVDVINCYNMGAVKITANATSNRAVGGIMGQTTTAWITNCYNFGDVSVNGSIPANTWGGITGTFQTTRQPINSYYATSSVANGNSYGTAITEANMLAPDFILTINNDQDPVKWVADADMINYGLPILNWEVNGITSVNRAEADVNILGSVTPNPVTGVSCIPVSMVVTGKVNLSLYNTFGQLVALVYDGVLEAGNHVFTVNAADYQSGIYFCRLITVDGEKTQRFVIK